MAHAGGRPPKFKTAEEVQKVIDEYFAYCDNRSKKVWDDKLQKEYMIADPAPYTMSGLARALNLSRQGLKEYGDKEEFSDTIKAARSKVEENIETLSLEKGGAGPIFNLKNNFGWKDEQHIEQKFSGNLTIVRYQYDRKSNNNPA